MYQDPQTECIRREVATTFEDLGAARGDCVIETLLIRDGYYCGRRFYCDGYQAVWFVEENQIKYFDAQGQLVKKSGKVPQPQAARRTAS